MEATWHVTTSWPTESGITSPEGRILLSGRCSEEAESILRSNHTRIFDFSGRPSRKMVYVGPKALQKDTDLERWLQITLKVVKSLPPKT
jgi:hypothetical protein